VNPVTPKSGTRLGELLVTTGRVSEADLERAIEYKRETGVKLGQALVQLELVSESDISDALREPGRVTWIHLTPKVINHRVARQLGESASKRFSSIAINEIAGIYTVALEDPTDVVTVDEISRLLDARVFAVHADPVQIRRCQELVFTRTSESDEDLSQIAGTESSDEGGEEIQGEQVVDLVQRTLEEAFSTGASDIHFECRREDFAIRYRVDGSMLERLSVPRSWAKGVIARLKVMASMDIAQRRLPQDGRVNVEISGTRVDLRVATSPCLYGEVAVIRILDGGRKLKGIETLGFDDRQLDDLYKMIGNKDGFVLATGPTGSGKTTTLYGLLEKLNSPDKKIITLEDPVENHLEGAVQIHADPKSGMTFAKGLRSILRQDPDVVLVGEIRDEETARIGIQASMTGHLVLSTLHTLGCAEAVVRLGDMGIEPYVLADSLRGAIAQRLVRKSCSECSSEVAADPNHVELLKDADLVDGEFTVMRGVGCDFCNGTGYSGRVALYEVMRVNPELQDIIRRGENTEQMRRMMREAGVVSLAQCAVQKVLEGKTTVEEVMPIVLQVV
jgi:type IV pilus assembly protein PilB